MDEKVLDPSCGSGTLLTEAYKRKRRLAPDTFSESALHKRLLSKIFGIDIMHFAYNMTSINLLAQDLTVPAILENIKAGDGLEPMILSVECIDDDPPMMRLIDWVETVKPHRLPHENFDLVIMNPPFTRRERLSEIGEINRLEKLFHDAFEGEVIRGKVGYWAYFMASADRMVKRNGKIAIVTPEEFFAGGSAESLRRFLFFNETFKDGKYKKIRKPSRSYTIDFVIRSGKDVAFSETALYRDYLVVFRKVTEKTQRPLSFVILKKPIDELNEEEVALNIREFASSLSNKESSDSYEALKVHNVGSFLKKHIDNLKPLVGFNTTKAQELFLDLIDMLSKHPTIGELGEQGYLKIRVYNPGQYVTKGVEDEARKLFVRRYKGRGKALFKYLGENDKSVTLSPIRVKESFKVSRSKVVPALRTYSGVQRFDITGSEEYALLDPKDLTIRIKKAKGIANIAKYQRAAADIKSAYKNLSGDILLVRRAQIPSPGLCWLAYYTANRAIGTTSALLNLRTQNSVFSKIITLYLNSSLALLQLMGFAVETRGAWITLHGDQVWKHIHLPFPKKISKKVEKEALRIFNDAGKINSKDLLSRIKSGDKTQMEIDKLALRLLDLENWIDKLDEIRSAVTDELESMLEILERSRKPSKKTRKLTKSRMVKGKQLVLDGY